MTINSIQPAENTIKMLSYLNVASIGFISGFAKYSEHNVTFLELISLSSFVGSLLSALACSLALYEKSIGKEHRHISISKMLGISVVFYVTAVLLFLFTLI